MIDFKNKNIILFSPFGSCKSYSEEIRDELILRGANVVLYDERPSQSVVTKIYIYLFRRFFPSLFINYIKRIIKICPLTKVDYILVVRGQGFDKIILDLLRDSYPGVVIILYQWDSLSSINAPNVIHEYDRAYSYDPSDVSANRFFVFRPTFYLRQYKDLIKPALYEYDICFVGTLYKDRWPIIKKFKDYIEGQYFVSSFYLYLSSKIVYFLYRLTSKEFAPIGAIHFNLLNGKDYISLVEKSRCILDINYTDQKGISLRAYEALASQRKYITTNNEIKKYDFYNPNNVLVVDANHINIPKEFIEGPFEPVEDAILYKYSVKGFIDEIFKNID